MPFFSAPSRKAEVYRFKLPTIILISLLALVLQTYLPLYLGFITILDLPLLIVIYFALTRRSPVPALLGGALIGMAQDSLARGPIGLFGVVKTVVGYVTSSAGTRFDTENTGIRFLTIFVLYGLHFFLLYFLGVALLGQSIEFNVRARFLAALANAIAGVLLFQLLDRFREPA